MTPEFAKQLIEEARGCEGRLHECAGDLEDLKARTKEQNKLWDKLVNELREIITREHEPTLEDAAKMGP